jgi:hypothetical protein
MERFSLLGRELPAWAVRRVSLLGPGRERAFDPAEWRGALVVVERGQIELVTEADECSRFVRGDVLVLAGLSLRALRNPGDQTAVLATLERRR